MSRSEPFPWVSVGALAGLGFAALQLVSGLLPGTLPPLDASGIEIAGFYADHRTALLVSALSGILAAPLFLIVAATIWTAGRDDPQDQALRVVFLSGVVIATAVSAVGTAAGAGLAYASQSPVDAETARVIYAFQTIDYLALGVGVLAFVPAGSLLLARVGFGSRSLVWLGWLVVAVAMLVSQFSILVTGGSLQPGGAAILARDYPFVVWVLFLSWSLFRAGRQAQPVAAGAPTRP